MRKLKTCDIPAFCRVVKSLDIKERLRTAAAAFSDEGSEGDEDITWNVGFELVWGLLDKASDKAFEEVVYEFFSGPFECTPEEFANLDLDELAEGIHHIVTENDLRSFFKFVQKAMK